MVKGDKCWIIENGFKVTSAKIVSISGNLVLLRTDNGKALRLPKHRLYDTEEEAERTLQGRNQAQKKMTPYDYMM